MHPSQKPSTAHLTAVQSAGKSLSTPACRCMLISPLLARSFYSTTLKKQWKLILSAHTSPSAGRITKNPCRWWMWWWKTSGSTNASPASTTPRAFRRTWSSPNCTAPTCCSTPCSGPPAWWSAGSPSSPWWSWLNTFPCSARESKGSADRKGSFSEIQLQRKYCFSHSSPKNLKFVMCKSGISSLLYSSK